MSTAHPPVHAPEDRRSPATSTPVERIALDLPRLVMRRTLWVAFGALVVTLLLGVVRAQQDTGQELEGALVLARVGERLAMLRTADEAQAVASLRSLGPMRHLRLQLVDGDGHHLLPDDPVGPRPALLGAFMAVNQRLFGAAVPQSVSWPVERAAGGTWHVTLTASPDSEQREALSNLGMLLALFAGCCALMLVVMHWNVRRALAPLHGMLGAIERIERQDLDGVRALPAMPIRELAAIAAALQHLAQALQEAEDSRRRLGHQVLTLQEDERQRLARDLHDEFGQRLTGLRVDASWLHKRLAGQPELARVAAGMGEQCALIQADVRDLLTRLRPLGPGNPKSLHEELARLHELLAALVTGWSESTGSRTRYAWLLLRRTVRGDVPVTARELQQLRLPRELVLAVYRISQEALTNVARHAGAGAVELRVVVRWPDEGADTGELLWSVQDDGVGLASAAAAMRQGNGLAGIKERVWTLGGEFACSGADVSDDDAAPRAGLTLRARLPFEVPGE